MITDLFVVTSGLDDAAVAAAVPPACRREPSPPAVVSASEGELLIELPEWRPRTPSRHMIPSVSVLAGAAYAARFELSAWAAGRWSPWVATATIGQGRLAGPPGTASSGGSDPGLVCDIDEYTAIEPCERLKLRVRVSAGEGRALAAAPWMITLSACDLGPLPPDLQATAGARLPVPALSQMEAPPEIALRICSPTSVAMVLGYWGAPTALLPLAAEVFHPETDRYGVWPAAIHAAGRRGVAGYVLRFPDWSSAAWCLERHLPIIASVAYAPGELTGAAMPATTGHLIVLTGCDGDHVFVNDPAASTPATVPRRYSLDELRRAWLGHGGVGYVLFPPGR